MCAQPLIHLTKDLAMFLKKICLLAAAACMLSACGVASTHGNDHALRITPPALPGSSIDPLAKPAPVEPGATVCPYTDCMKKVGEAGLSACMREKGYDQP